MRPFISKITGNITQAEASRDLLQLRGERPLHAVTYTNTPLTGTVMGKTALFCPVHGDLPVNHAIQIMKYQLRTARPEFSNFKMSMPPVPFHNL